MVKKYKRNYENSIKDLYGKIKKMTELQRCSNCKCMKLLSFFKVRKNTGIILKTCIQCGEERFKCDQDRCNYKCSSNARLQVHIKAVHDKIKDHECPDCDYKCTRNAHLQLHIKTVHDKIKDYECPDCEFKSSTNTGLQVHINTCTGLRNISSGEFKIIQCLEELGFFEDEDYRYNSTLSELTKYCGKTLRFDFIFILFLIVIEYDGEQHERPVRFGGISQEEAEEKFQKTKDYDKLKDDFCRDNGYKMVRISYKDYPNILSILHTELLDIMDNVG